MEASSIDGGTDLIADRAAITIVGRVITAKVSPPTSGADLGREKKFKNIAKPRSPKTIDGTAAKLLMLVSMVLENLFFNAIFSMYRADRTPSGKDTINAINIA